MATSQPAANYAPALRSGPRWTGCTLGIASQIVPLAALINLNHPASYVHAGFFQMSASNLAVIIVMIIVFALAIALPFPGSRRGGSGS
jgi:hypothetical protein